MDEKISYRETGDRNTVSLDLARHEVDVMVIQRRACEHGAVRVEGRAGDGGGAVVVEEARVRLKGGEIGTVDVEGLDLVAVCAPVKKVSRRIL